MIVISNIAPYRNPILASSSEECGLYIVSVDDFLVQPDGGPGLVLDLDTLLPPDGVFNFFLPEYSDLISSGS